MGHGGVCGVGGHETCCFIETERSPERCGPNCVNGSAHVGSGKVCGSGVCSVCSNITREVGKKVEWQWQNNRRVNRVLLHHCHKTWEAHSVLSRVQARR